MHTQIKSFFSDFLVELVEHNFPLGTVDHTGKLFRNMLPDFKIVINKHRMTTHMLTGAVVKQITSDLNKELLLTRQKKLATDGYSDEDYKFFPILVRHVDKDSQLIIVSSE